MSWRAAIDDLFTDYGWLLDNDKLEEWTGLFTESARYDVIPRENFDRGMPLCLIACRNRTMLRDRILALRVANQFNIHHDRHVIGRSKIVEEGAGRARVETNYLVLQTDQGGSTKVFSAGAYRSVVVREDGAMRLAEQIVVVDTFCVPTLIATPI